MTQNRTETYLYKHEKEAQEKRRKVAEALENGSTYAAIQRDLGVSTSTISAVKKMMKGGV